MKKIKFVFVFGLTFLIILLSSCEIININDLINYDKTDVLTNSINESDDSIDYIENKSNSEIIDDSSLSAVALSLYEYENDYKNLYGYNALSLDEKYGDFMQNVYESFYIDAHNFLASEDDYEVYEEDDFKYIIIGEYEYKNLKYTDIIASAWITFIEENPLYYFTYTAYKVKINETDNTYSFLFLGGADYANALDRYEANTFLLELLEDFKNEYDLLESKDDYSISKMIHDYICNKISYAYDESGSASEECFAHNVLGLTKGEGVCECYAESYLLLSYLTNLNALIVIGNSNGGGHVWNYVMIDNIWYGVDATWDDGDKVSYDYFLVSSKIMNKSHNANKSTSYGINYQVDLPILSTTSYDKTLDNDAKDYNNLYPSITPFRRIPSHR